MGLSFIYGNCSVAENIPIIFWAVNTFALGRHYSACGRSWYNHNMKMVEQNVTKTAPMRPAIVKAVVVCLAVAVAPWLTGGQEPVGMLMSGFALLLGTLLVWRQPGVRELGRGPLGWSFGLLMILAVVSLLWTANQYSSVIWIAQWVMAALAFRFTYAIALDAGARKWVINAYLISVVIFCGVAIWMYLTSQYGRLTGTFYWANPAAAYLLPAIILAVDGVRRSVGRKTYAWMALAILFGGSFLLADSRATTAVLFVILILYLLLLKLNKRFWIHFVFIIVAAYGLSFGLVKLSTITVQHSEKVTPGSRLAEAAKGEAMSGSDRLYYLDSAFRMWFEHPVAGVGAGAFGDAHPRYQQRVVSASASVHNVYVQVLAELGLAGAVLLAAVLLSLMLGSLRGLVANPELVPSAIGALGVLMHAGLDIDARYPALLSLVGVFFGLIYAQQRSRWVKLSWRWPALVALVLVPVVSLYLSETQAQRGRVAQENEDYGLAATHFAQAATGLVYNPDLLTAEGINRYTLGDADSAINRARAAQRLDPYDGQHYQLEGRARAQKGDLKGAEAAFRQALARDGLNHPDYALDLASVVARDKRPDEAVQIAQGMLALYPVAVVNNRVADETLRPTLANLEALVGNMALEAGRLGEAKAAADRALKLDPKSLRGRALKHQTEKLLSVPAAQ